MATGPKPYDVARVTLGVACLVALLAGTLWILRPFLGAMIWAATIVVATWPIMMRLEARVGGRRAISAATMSAVCNASTSRADASSGRPSGVAPISSLPGVTTDSLRSLA